MKGMNINNGKSLEGIAHIKQSIEDILKTPLGTRVMRRDYGSRLFELLDHPIGSDTIIELYGAVAEALLTWEPRFKLEKVEVSDLKNGSVSLALRGSMVGGGHSIVMHNIRI